MPSAIDATKPNDVALYTGDLRSNLALAKTELAHGGFFTLPLSGTVERTSLSRLSESVSVRDFGAVEDSNLTAGNGTDNTSAFQAALNAVGQNGVVFVPRTSPTLAYRLAGTVTLTNRRLVGRGNPIIFHDPSTAVDAIVLDASITVPAIGSQLIGMRIQGGAQGRDLVTVKKGDHVRLDNLQLNNAIRDGVHIEGIGGSAWIENLLAIGVKVNIAGQDAFHCVVSTAGNFFNQSVFLNCESRGPTRHALSLVNTVASSTGVDKISALTWINGELAVAQAGSNAGVLIQTTNIGAIESIKLQQVAIEDTDGTHAGTAILIDKQSTGKTGPLILDDVITFGFTGGRISGEEDLAGFEDRAWSMGDPIRAADSTWDGSHPQLGAYHLWIDATGALRSKSTAPSSDLDGLDMAGGKLVIPVEITSSGNAQIAHAGPNVLVAGNSGSTIVYTIQPNATIAIPRYSVINLSMRGAGAFQVAAGAGVTLNLPADRTAVLRAQHSGASLHHDPLNTWTLFGDLAS